MSPDAELRCFYCRRGMHDSCISGAIPCPCCDEDGAA